jgi:hypothetical protein
MQYLTDDENEVLRDMVEPIAGWGDSDDSRGAMMIYRVTVPIAQTWVNDVTHTVPAGMWARSVDWKHSVAYRVADLPDADMIDAAGLDVTLAANGGTPYSWQDVAAAHDRRDDA